MHIYKFIFYEDLGIRKRSLKDVGNKEMEVSIVHLR